MNKKNNRKSKMTKKIFQDTMLDLLEHNHISEISVKGLCEAADFNRSTFYSYYQNQMDILLEIERQTYSDLEDVIMSGIHPNEKTDSKLIFEQLLGYVKEHPKLFRVLLGPNGSRSFHARLMDLTERGAKVSGLDLRISEPAQDYVRQYRIAGCTTVIETWITKNFDLSIEEMAQLLIQLSVG